MEDDCILLYTDGLYEGRGTNKNVGVLEVNDRIKAIYDGTSSLESFIEDLYYHFAGEENTTNDDIGIMAIRIK